MDRILRNILLVAVFSFAASFDSCAFGTAYDAHHRLYPESDPYSCTFSQYYGARWQRLGTAFFYLSLGSLVAVFIHLRREEQAQHFESLSIFKR